MTARGRVEEFGDLGDSLAAGFDVAHGGAGRLVPGLGHDELQRDFLVAEMSGGAVAELVEFPGVGAVGDGVVAEKDAAPVVAEPGPAGVRADVAGRCPAVARR